VSIGSLTSKGPGDERMLKGDIELTGIRLVEGSEAAQQDKPAAKAQNRPKRGRK
jgi:hypothetical protein